MACSRRSLLKQAGAISLGGIATTGFAGGSDANASSLEQDVYVFSTEKFLDEFDKCVINEPERLPDTSLCGTYSTTRQYLISGELQDQLANLNTSLDISSTYSEGYMSIPSGEIDNESDLGTRADEAETWLREKGPNEFSLDLAGCAIILDYVPDDGAESSAFVDGWSASYDIDSTSNITHTLNFEKLQNRSGFHEDTGWVGIVFRALADLVGANSTDASTVTEGGESVWTLGTPDPTFSFCGDSVDWSADEQALTITDCTRNAFP